MSPEPTPAEMRRDMAAEQWLIDHHDYDWNIGNASTAEWREAYRAVDAAQEGQQQ